MKNQIIPLTPLVPADPSFAAHEPGYFRSSSLADMYHESLGASPQRKIGGAFLYEDTLTYLFSRTNYGKSILVFQLAYAAATGTSFADKVLQNECPPMKVLVVDLELDARAIISRHGTAIKRMDSALVGNLLYLHEKVEKRMLLGFDLLDKIEDAAIQSGAQLVIIDNISKLLPNSLKPETVTLVINALNQIRLRTGASMLVIGHTTKGNPQTAVQPTDYFGSSMVQNFFYEVSFLDRTTDGKFFLCHSKTKHQECYTEEVPVFIRGDHPVTGLGFNYECNRTLKDIQLPFAFQTGSRQKKKNLNCYIKEILILGQGGISHSVIADIFGVSRNSIYRILEANRFTR